MTTALPARAGIGFKPKHLQDLARPGAVSWLEIHAENYMIEGGPRLAMLMDLAERFPISVHGVGLSIGGEGPLDRLHLRRLQQLLDRIRPAQFSEHLAWSTHQGAYYSDLLPLPYTEATLRHVADHVSEVQDRLGLQMLLENPTSYLRLADSTIPEPEFLARVAEKTGCGMLLDLNNLFLSSVNVGIGVEAYLAAYPLERTGEIHLAGHVPDPGGGGELLIDSHSTAVADPVWALCAEVIGRIGPRPVLIEWDEDVPEFAILEAEAARAQALLDEVPA
ncbi:MULTISPECIES: MNIO family bufferin maturase [Thioclava]|uniref:DUF692 domain-containing protein n=1 Tax=Thioclava kandeliae TaxID=3070818 RepID=A0ABV1SCK3_9RHOB